MIFDFLLTTVGLTVLILGGDLTVRGAASLATRLGISPLAIGLTVVAFGTSAPELFVNVTAALKGNTDLSFGNIFGSNMANIGLIVAVTAMLGPLRIQNVVVSREVPMMMLATLVTVALASDGVLGTNRSMIGRNDGIVLLLLFSVFGYYTLHDMVRMRAGVRYEYNEESLVDGEPSVSDFGLNKSLLMTFGGFLFLAGGGAITVHGAESLARGFGVSDVLIGLTLIAVGTSLPELVASIIASLKGHADMALGNVVGSNIFNLLIVLGVTSTIREVPVPAGGFADLGIAVLLSGMLWLISVSRRRVIIRTEAGLLWTVYIVYLVTRSIGNA